MNTMEMGVAIFDSNLNLLYYNDFIENLIIKNHNNNNNTVVDN
jgi:hypothetical protein